MNKVKVSLRGNIWGSINKEWDLAVISLGEAMRAIEINTQRKFFVHLLENDKKGIRYQVIINGKQFESQVPLDNIENVRISELSLTNPNLKTIDIVPVIEGSDNDVLGILTTVLGVVLIAVSFIPGFQPLIVAGIGLLAAGVSSLLIKPPAFQDFREIENSEQRPSYFFNGAENVIGEGGPVPIGYGRLIVGSQVISQSISVRNVGVDEFTGANGDLDSSYKSFLDFGNWGPYANTRSIDIYGDGTPVAGIKWSYYNKGLNFLSKIREDGFPQNILTRVNGEIRAIKVVSNGDIYIGGIFDGILDSSGSNYQKIVRGILKVTNTKSTEHTFNNNISSGGGVGTNFDRDNPNGNSVETIGVQSDGKVIVAGSFSTINGTSRRNIARINTDGTADATFDAGSQFNSGMIRKILVLSDDTIIVGGDFTGGVRKLTANGSSSATFNSNIGTAVSSGSVRAIAEDTSGNIFIGGSFTSFDGGSVNLGVKLSSVGVVDGGFNLSNISYGQNGIINTMSFDINGALLIGGIFTVLKDGDLEVKCVDRVSSTSGASDQNFIISLEVTNCFNLIPRINLTEPIANSSFNFSPIADPLNDSKIYVDGQIVFRNGPAVADNRRYIRRVYG